MSLHCCSMPGISTSHNDNQCPAGHVWTRCLQASHTTILLLDQNKTETCPLIQIQEIAGFLGDAIISTMVAYASAQTKLEQATRKLGKELAVDMVLICEKLDQPASTCLHYTPRLSASSFNSFITKVKKGSGIKFIGK